MKLIDLLSKLWRHLPKRVRRWGVLLTESRFTVTTGAIVIDQVGRVLLLQHRFRPGEGWGIPGGFVLPAEQPEDAIRRELREEMGLEIADVEIVFARALGNYQQVEIIYRCRPNQNSGSDLFPQNHEVSNAAWFTIDSLPQGLSNDQRRLIKMVLKATREKLR